MTTGLLERPRGEWRNRVYIPSDEEVLAWRQRCRDRDRADAVWRHHLPPRSWYRPIGTPPVIAGGASQTFSTPSIPFSQNTATIVSASTTETAMHVSLPLGSNQATSGSHYRISVWGAYNSSASSIPTSTFRIRLGTNGSGGTVSSDTSVAASAAFTPTASQVNATFFAACELEVYTPTGQGLTVAEIGTGQVNLGLSTSTTALAPWFLPQSAPATVAVATNQNLFLSLTVTLSSTTSGNSWVAWQYSLEDIGR